MALPRKPLEECIQLQSNGCILWTHTKNADGYGVHRFVVNRKRMSILAHRWMWTKTHGKIPKGLCVLHRCDVRNCVNVEHLFLGTHADNMADMVAKGRAVNGVGTPAYDAMLERRDYDGPKNPNAKLSKGDLKRIQVLRKSGWSQQRIADEFGVTQVCISKNLRKA
jgi:hypothetical protein